MGRATVASLSSSRSAFVAMLWLLVLIAAGSTLPLSALQDNPYLVVYEGTDGPGVGKHIVLIAGDHEYRSEEIMPAMARILAKNLGFKCSVFFTLDDEGFIEPGNMKEEGPFGEWTGYYGSKMRSEPVMDVKAIYHRNNPILLGCPPQRPPDELARYRAVTRSALLKENIAKAGVPDVTAAWLHEVGTAQ